MSAKEINGLLEEFNGKLPPNAQFFIAIFDRDERRMSTASNLCNDHIKKFAECAVKDEIEARTSAN